MTKIKHKNWIGNILRTRGDIKTRHGKLRLDKNERVSSFEESFTKIFFEKLKSDHFNAYPETEVLYKKLSQHHNINIDKIIVTAGSDAAIRNCFDLFVSPGDKIITLNPTFAMVDVYSKIFNAKQIKINYDKNLKINIDEILNNIDNSLTLIIIANPNSPTGTIIPIEDMQKIISKANICKAAVLVDEAYFGFCKETTLPLLSNFSNLIISRTFSKSYGIAGLRVGYLLTNQTLAKLLYAIKPMYEVNSLGLLSAIILLDNPNINSQYISDVKVGKELLINFLVKNNINFINTFTNFIFINIESNVDNIVNVLNDHGIIISKGLPISGYEKYLRITIGPKKQIQRVITILQKLIK